MGLQGFELLRAYAGDLLELVNGGEGTVLGPVVEDSLGEDGAYARESVQLVEGGGVEVHGDVGRGRRAGSGGGRGLGGGLGLGGQTDDDLFAVGYLAREIERCQIDAPEWAAGEGEYVGHARAGRSTDQPGATNLPGDVDYDTWLN
jgi:hypothetical protein